MYRTDLDTENIAIRKGFHDVATQTRSPISSITRTFSLRTY